MRKLLTFIAAVFITGNLLAGGLITNVNQSAAWIRLPSRNASLGIDAVFYNPAGLMKLENGFHLSISNQSVSQNRIVVNNYAGPGGSYGLNQHRYKGSVSAPIFPGVYAVYKLDKFAFSFGFNPVGGGGGAEYKKGLPSFEMSASDLVPSLQSAYGADAYKVDAYFKGSSVFFGYQGNVSYKVNDWLSVALGLRFVTAKNTYEGHLQDIEVELVPGGWTRADAIMTGIASSATTAAAATTGLVAAGAGTLTLAQVQGAGYITALQRAQLEGALSSFGYPVATPVAAADAIFKGAAAKYTATATLLGDQSADAEQTGTGIAPIISLNFTPNENLNIAVKYEFATKLELTNKTKQDLLLAYDASGAPITMFPNGSKVRNDIPAMLSVGLGYKLSSNLSLSLGAYYFFDKQANYGHTYDYDHLSSTPSVAISNKDIITKNGMLVSGGLEYTVSPKLLLSCGYQYGNMGVNKLYESDLTYGNATHTFGIGGAYSVTDKIQINLGLGYTRYIGNSKIVDHVIGSSLFEATESYGKSTKMIGLGVDFKF
jgi:long-chain fatty acid transport protein